MCSILGVITRNCKFDISDDLISRMNRTLQHRGPDGDGLICNGNVVFAHNRLSIIGLEEKFSKQPLENCGKMLTFNGEIYNYKHVSTLLESEGVFCSKKSDTEVLFKGLMHWGLEKTLRLIDGMFAFAYLDLDRKRLFLVRDRLGEKPLYWSFNGKRLCFSSEIKAIISNGDMPVLPNLSKINEFFHTGKVQGSETFFKDVFEVEPGKYLEISLDLSNIKSSNYWNLEQFNYDFNNTTDDFIKDDFLEKLTSSICSRSTSDVPIGVLLSGGIDSNSIVKLMSEFCQHDDYMELFFADNHDNVSSEMRDVKLFINYLNDKHSAVDFRLNRNILSLSEYMGNLSKFTWYNDEPIQFPISPQLLELTSLSSSLGVKVLQSGEGADELLFGYSRFTRTRDILMTNNSDKDSVLSNIYYGGGLDRVSEIDELTNGVSDKCIDTESWDWLSRHYSTWPNDTLQMIYSQKYRLQSLLQRQDRGGMANGVEVRVPFLSPEFVKWVNELPLSVKYDSYQTKKILRDVMNKRLPKRILSKNKQGSPSFISSFLESKHGYSTILKMVSRENGFSQSFLNGKKAVDLVHDHYLSSGNHGVIMWMFLSLEVWHNTWILKEDKIVY
jgi:asparagine synthase (glutamine-hydrolysing)